MNKLEKQAYEIACMSKKTIKSIEYFTGNEDFDAYYTAEKYVIDNGFHQGSMCGDEPIAIAGDNIGYIAKWRNINPKEYPKMSGVMVSNCFRTDCVAVAIFN